MLSYLLVASFANPCSCFLCLHVKCFAALTPNPFALTSLPNVEPHREAKMWICSTAGHECFIRPFARIEFKRMGGEYLSADLAYVSLQEYLRICTGLLFAQQSTKQPAMCYECHYCNPNPVWYEEGRICVIHVSMKMYEGEGPEALKHWFLLSHDLQNRTAAGVPESLIRANQWCSWPPACSFILGPTHVCVHNTHVYNIHAPNVTFMPVKHTYVRWSDHKCMGCFPDETNRSIKLIKKTKRKTDQQTESLYRGNVWIQS